MLSRFVHSTTRPLLLRALTLTSTSSLPTSSPPILPPLPSPHLPIASRTFSGKPPTRRGGDDSWKLIPDQDEEADSLFGDLDDGGDLAGLEEDLPKGGPIPTEATRSVWAEGEDEEKKGGDIFEEIDRELEVKKGGVDEWETVEGFKPWGFDEEEKGEVFDFGDGEGEVDVENEKAEAIAELELKEKELQAVLKGPDRAFGDLIELSGITDEMLDSLILLKDVSGVEGLPSLQEIEDMYAERGDDTSRFEEEQKKQQEITKARVKQVDEKGRAYGTGRRKCSIARVFIQPGDGKFIINDKQFDVYFPSLDHRAELLNPFMVTNTVGQWDVKCTVKGGGLSGQVGAIRLGISRALQNFEPGLRAYLKTEGYLTRDPRVVERKKPGKAKARKSFQWVKR